MGDFTLLGWTTTFLYAVGCWLSYRTYSELVREEGNANQRVKRRGWAILLVFLLALGLNKQLDLQILLIRAGRDLVVALELYQLHRPVQVAVFVGAAAFVFTSFFVTLPIFVRADQPLRLGLTGLGLIASYVLFRVALFQRISSKVDIEAVTYLEPIGILLVCWAAWIERKGSPSRGPG